MPLLCVCLGTRARGGFESTDEIVLVRLGTEGMEPFVDTEEFVEAVEACRKGLGVDEAWPKAGRKTCTDDIARMSCADDVPCVLDPFLDVVAECTRKIQPPGTGATSRSFSFDS
jgi:hypothetical protein